MGVLRWSATLVSRLVKAPGFDLLVHGGETLDRTIRLVYARRRGVAGCYVFWVLSRIIASGEVLDRALGAWLAVKLYYSNDLGKCCASHSRGCVSRTRCCGRHEGGYILLGNLLNIPGEMALALSLVRRARELVLGIPGLVAWQLVEAGRLLRHRRRRLI
jgi:hypothetical protein